MAPAPRRSSLPAPARRREERCPVPAQSPTGRTVTSSTSTISAAARPMLDRRPATQRAARTSISSSARPAGQERTFQRGLRLTPLQPLDRHGGRPDGWEAVPFPGPSRSAQPGGQRLRKDRAASRKVGPPEIAAAKASPSAPGSSPANPDSWPISIQHHSRVTMTCPARSAASGSAGLGGNGQPLQHLHEQGRQRQR